LQSVAAASRYKSYVFVSFCLFCVPVQCSAAAARDVL